MDPRRLLMLAWAGPWLAACTTLPDVDGTASLDAAPAAERTDAPAAAEAVRLVEVHSKPEGAVPYAVIRSLPDEPVAPTLRGAGETRSETDGEPAPTRIGGAQLLSWSPGQVYDVRAAPLRVTTLTLGPGEVVLSKAAGDTVRWQIGEAASGEGAGRRTHVLLKPLQRGLETNLVLTTNRRVYFLNLKSVAPDRFDAAVTWDDDAFVAAAPDVADPPERTPADPAAVGPDGPVDAGYRIEPQGRRARWTPTAVFNDGQRTFITFDADLAIDEAPALFVLDTDGQAQLVNFRQRGNLFIVDRVFDRAELRLGDRRPQVVRLHRRGGTVR